MNRSTLATAAAASLFVTTSAIAQPVTIDWSTVGNAGNAPDPLNSNDVPGIGVVAYEYRIGTYEVTNAQYAAFLNSVAASDPNGLYNALMGSDARGGITRSGTDGSYTYTTRPNMGDKPVNFVSWFDAARMCNWMTNGQGSGGTESGVYTLDGVDSISAITRDLSNPNQVFIPNEDEWYKAAYHQPTDQGGDTDDYWLYATQSNLVPTVASTTSIGDVANPGQDVVNYLRLERQRDHRGLGGQHELLRRVRHERQRVGVERDAARFFPRPPRRLVQHRRELPAVVVPGQHHPVFRARLLRVPSRKPRAGTGVVQPRRPRTALRPTHLCRYQRVPHGLYRPGPRRRPRRPHRRLHLRRHLRLPHRLQRRMPMTHRRKRPTLHGG
jgi:hypothetical protein